MKAVNRICSGGKFVFVVLTTVTLGLAVPAKAQDAGLPSPTATALPAKPTPQNVVPDGLPSRPAVGVNDNYHLGSGDRVRVTVYGETDLSGEFVVDGSGHIQLPLIGQVVAGGLSVHDFTTAVQDQLQSGYLKSPRVNVEVMNYRPFYIIGEVNKPGEYPYESGLTLLGAVALAGGFTYRADTGDAYVRKLGGTREEDVKLDNSAKVTPGDIIRVSERFF